jgi:hypothetical protein
MKNHLPYVFMFFFCFLTTQRKDDHTTLVSPAVIPTKNAIIREARSVCMLQRQKFQHLWRCCSVRMSLLFG